MLQCPLIKPKQSLEAKLIFALFQLQVRRPGCWRTEDIFYFKGAGVRAAEASPQAGPWGWSREPTGRCWQTKGEATSVTPQGEYISPHMPKEGCGAEEHNLHFNSPLTQGATKIPRVWFSLHPQMSPHPPPPTIKHYAGF